jgi:hypothetical protein
MSELDGLIGDCFDMGMDLCNLSLVVAKIEGVTPRTESQYESIRLILIFQYVLMYEQWSEWWETVYGDELEVYKQVKYHRGFIVREDLDEKLTKDSDGSESE